MVDGELYSVLGVSRDATASDIKQAFRRLAKSLHPDRNQRDPAAEERFKRITHAYEILSDARKRDIYDRFGEMGLEDSYRGPRRAETHAQAAPAAAAYSFGGRRASAGPTADVGGFRVNEVFGGGARRARSRPGANLSCTATLDLVEAVRGCEREVRIGRSEASPVRVVRVRIPAGVRNGERLRLPGLGRQGSRGGAPGDLFLVVRLRDHPHFFLEGGDLHLRLPITPLEAYDGANIEIPTPHGPVQVRVPPRSQAGTTLRVRSRGIRRGEAAEPGDLFLHLRVVLPTDDGLRDAYAHLDGAISGAVRQGLRFD